MIEREEGRLDDLKNGPDPIIQALIRMAECYVSMKQPDEARTILHRLIAHATLTPDQQQEVDFQTLYSYAMGGQTDQANKALDDYLAKHAGDPQADSIGYQIAAKLLERKDYAGALAQAERSRKDFPKGRYLSDVIALQAQALTRLGRIAESNKVIDDYVAKNPKSPVANQMFLTKAQSESARGDFTAALADYQKVKDNASAGPDLQSGAAAGYIQTLQSQQRFDEVISEAKDFETKYSTSKALPSVLLIAGLALEEKHDPGAVAALQDVARKFPKDDASPFALYYVVNIYQRANNLPAMVEATNNLRTAYPTAYSFLAQASDAVGSAYLKDKNFDQAIALYQPLTETSKPDVAASVRNKIGVVWLAAAKALGFYQSMPLDDAHRSRKATGFRRAGIPGHAQKLPDPDRCGGRRLRWFGEHGQAASFLGPADRRRYGGLSGQTHGESHRAGHANAGGTGQGWPRFYLQERGHAIPGGTGALQKGDRRQPRPAPDTAGDRPVRRIAPRGKRLSRRRCKVYSDLLNRAAPNDVLAQADGLYGLGSIFLAQGDVAHAKEKFSAMEALTGGALWHPHILDADYGLALANEQSAQQADNDQAKQIYAKLMQSPQGGIPCSLKAMLGYGRLLEKGGHALTPLAPGTSESAVHYYQEPHTLFGPAAPELSAEGLFDAGQAYEKAGDKANAKKQYDDLLKNYGTTAPDWAAKARPGGRE